MKREVSYFVMTFIIASALASTLGCVSTGQLNGRLAVPDEPSPNVKFDFKSDRMNEQEGTLSATLPGGESFSGKYVQITSTTEEHVVAPFFDRWAPYWTDWGSFGDPGFHGGDFTAFRTSYSNKVVATLFGDQGDTMRCRFRLGDPPAGLSGGGTGECQVLNGGKIAVQF